MFGAVAVRDDNGSNTTSSCVKKGGGFQEKGVTKYGCSDIFISYVHRIR